jgi:preprotein translocase subunit YajC
MFDFLPNLLISDVFAQDTVAQSQGGIMSFVPLLLIFGVFYFLLIRPQQKRAKEHQETLGNLKSGNEVRTNGGIIGIIKRVHNKEDVVDLEIANGVIIKMAKQNILEVIVSKKSPKSLNTKTKKKVATKSTTGSKSK